MQRIGELVAFGTAVCWTLSAMFFERGIKRIGVLAVNFIRLVLAVILLTIAASLLRGMPIPFDAPLTAWIFLPLSGLMGFVITDLLLFTAYGTVGPRISLLFLALSPPITAGIAYLFLDDTLSQRGFLGMALVVIGICMTVFGKQNSFGFSNIKKEDRKGYFFALCASVSQAIGMNLTKIGVSGYDPVSGTQIRAFTAVIGFALISLLFDRGMSVRKGLKNPGGMKFTAMGAVFGPFLGVALSLYALQRTSAGIVSTLIGLSPVLIILPEIFIFKKKIKPLEITGALIAVCGTAIFFL